MDKKEKSTNEVSYGKLIINPAWCKGCGVCVAFCPMKVLSISNDKVKVDDIEKCTQCGMCEMRCPDFAIYLGRKSNERKS